MLLAYEEAAGLDVDSLGKLERFAETTITDPDALRAELAQIHERGYAFSNGELDRGVRGVAAPIFAADGTIAAGISVGTLAFLADDNALPVTIDTVRGRRTRLEGPGPDQLVALPSPLRPPDCAGATFVLKCRSSVLTIRI